MSTQPHPHPQPQYLTFRDFFQSLSADEKTRFAEAIPTQKIYLWQIAGHSGKHRPSGPLARRIEELALSMYGKHVPRSWMRPDIYGTGADAMRILPPARREADAKVVALFAEPLNRLAAAEEVIAEESARQWAALKWWQRLACRLDDAIEGAFLFLRRPFRHAYLKPCQSGLKQPVIKTGLTLDRPDAEQQGSVLRDLTPKS